LLLLLYLGPRVAQRDRAIEDETVLARIAVDAEVTLPLELVAAFGSRARQTRLHLAARHDLERVGVQVHLPVHPLGDLARILDRLRSQIAFWYERDTISLGELKYHRENHQQLADALAAAEARILTTAKLELLTTELQTERARLLAENELVHDRLAEVFAKNEEYDRLLTDTYAEIDRLNAILSQIYGSRSWKLQLLLDRLRGRS
jgi:hypothetical protein